MTSIADRNEIHHRKLKPLRLSGAALPQARIVRLDSGALALAGASDADWVGATTRIATSGWQACLLRNTSELGLPVEAADVIAAGDVAYLAADGRADVTGTVRLGVALRGASAEGRIALIVPD